jgi:DNA (cytosine-5)-methyltransferase 1
MRRVVGYTGEGRQREPVWSDNTPAFAAHSHRPAGTFVVGTSEAELHRITSKANKRRKAAARLSQDITVTDLFCGAGGSSIGAERAGAVLKMAANHWRLAIDTHNTNFPNADHDCADVSQVNPRRYPRTDILIASPECTNHSSAKTNKIRATIWDPKADEAEERSRATMWDVPRFAEFHRYELVVVENVVEARRWEPFEAWLGAMGALGYEHRALYLNSMVAHPTPQSRDRMYVVFWRRGNTAPDLEFRPIAWCVEHGDVAAIQTWKQPTRPWGKYRAQYVYRCPIDGLVALPYAWPAAAAIDWSLPAPRIGDRDRPLADATLRRIRAGLDRYGPTAIVQAAGHTFERPGYYRTWPMWEPLGTQTTTVQHGLVVETAYTGRSDNERSRSTEEPLGTLTGQQSAALVVAMRQGNGKRVTRAVDPLAAVVATASTHALLVPMRGTSDAAIASSARSVQAPTGPQTTQPHDALVVALRTHGTAEPADISPVPTIVAGNAGHALLMRNYTPRGNPAQMTHPIDAPAGTITGSDHHSLLTTPFLTDYHGIGRPWQARGVDQPMGTIETVDRRALVEPASVDVDDCGFRMLEPHEIGRAMAFADDYVVLGNKRERVRQYGNAVTPPVMSLILERAIASLAP